MPRTYCIAELKFEDITAIEDSTITAQQSQSFSDYERLKTNSPERAYATKELNQFVLDGSKPIMPETVSDIAFMSAQMSDDKGLFANNPKINISFSENHTSAGITLVFTEWWADELEICWYSAKGTKIDAEKFHPDSLVYTCYKQVENYAKISIEFIHTAFPKSYVKLQYIAYGYTINWEDMDITDAILVEEVDVTSSELSINTASISVLDEKGDYDVSNALGLWHSIQRGQSVELREYVDDKIVPLGMFYIDSWSWSNNVVQFGLVDTVGMLDRYKYYNGRIYDGIRAGNIIADVCAVAKVQYTVEPEIAEVLLSGYLGIMTCREALQMVAFATNSVVDDSRRDHIRIFKENTTITDVVGTDRKINGATTLSLEPYVSGVSIESFSYTLEEDESELYKGILFAGDNRIETTTPYDPSTIVAENATVVEAKTNYVIVNLANDGECTIKGKKYESNSVLYRKDVEDRDANQDENVVEYSGCTLYSMELIPEIAQKLLKYHGMRQKLSMRYLLDSEAVGDWVQVFDTSLNSSITKLESQSIDLAKGFVATVKCRGYSSVQQFIQYTKEIYTGEQLGVII